MDLKLFNIVASCSKTSARTGIINTDHGKIETPFFMPVGTHAAVKTQTSEEIATLPSSILLSNTYHLYLRPGIEILFPAPEVLEKNVHVVDRDVARYFYEVNNYYGMFEMEFNRKTATVGRLLDNR